MSEPIRVLQVVTYMGRGGLETMLMNYYRNIDRDKVQFDFLTHRDERWDYDDEIESYVCDVNMDEDDYARFLSSSRTYCPYYQSNDEYKIVRHQM